MPESRNQSEILHAGRNVLMFLLRLTDAVLEDLNEEKEAAKAKGDDLSNLLLKALPAKKSLPKTKLPVAKKKIPVSSPSEYRKRILEIAESYLGREEHEDRAWVAEINAEAAQCNSTEGCWLTGDDAWCASFAGHVVSKVGLKPPPRYFRASEWAGYGPGDPKVRYKWGREIGTMGELMPGDLVVCKRRGIHHVAFVHHIKDNGQIYVIGGNQSDSVSIIPLPLPVVYAASPV